MSKQKTYFCMSSEDYAPEKLIVLGQIITNLRKPWEKLTGPPPKLPLDINIAHKDDYERESTKGLSACLGLFANFAAILTGNASTETRATSSQQSSTICKCSKLETMFFEPDAEFAKSVVQDPAVKEFLDKNVFTGRSVYVVTGIKIARGASISKTRQDGFAINASAAISTGAQTSIGPSISIQKTSAETETFGNSSDFVYAYRLRKISVNRQGKASSKEVTGGELHGYGGSDGEESEEDEEPGEIESADVEGIDFGLGFKPQGFGLLQGEDETDGESCRFLFPLA
ncbi:hypothetical protein EG328_001517 [Venturia inaequalis]|uniref:Uncharacterized protein n=1 Tax=Venturia inaequalis TaxID=5025 RepID=A0A8H3U253_VENIN|nr:hypothetical protein EG328_001517 [Venturia inaequalis]